MVKRRGAGSRLAPEADAEHVGRTKHRADSTEYKRIVARLMKDKGGCASAKILAQSKAT